MLNLRPVVLEERKLPAEPQVMLISEQPVTDRAWTAAPLAKPPMPEAYKSFHWHPLDPN